MSIERITSAVQEWRIPVELFETIRIAIATDEEDNPYIDLSTDGSEPGDYDVPRLDLSEAQELVIALNEAIAQAKGDGA